MRAEAGKGADTATVSNASMLTRTFVRAIDAGTPCRAKYDVRSHVSETARVRERLGCLVSNDLILVAHAITMHVLRRWNGGATMARRDATSR